MKIKKILKFATLSLLAAVPVITLPLVITSCASTQPAPSPDNPAPSPDNPVPPPTGGENNPQPTPPAPSPNLDFAEIRTEVERLNQLIPSIKAPDKIISETKFNNIDSNYILNQFKNQLKLNETKFRYNIVIKDRELFDGITFNIQVFLISNPKEPFQTTGLFSLVYKTNFDLTVLQKELERISQFRNVIQLKNNDITLEQFNKLKENSFEILKLISPILELNFQNFNYRLSDPFLTTNNPTNPTTGEYHFVLEFQIHDKNPDAWTFGKGFSIPFNIVTPEILIQNEVTRISALPTTLPSTPISAADFNNVSQSFILKYCLSSMNLDSSRFLYELRNIVKSETSPWTMNFQLAIAPKNAVNSTFTLINKVFTIPFTFEIVPSISQILLRNNYEIISGASFSITPEIFMKDGSTPPIPQIDFSWFLNGVDLNYPFNFYSDIATFDKYNNKTLTVVATYQNQQVIASTTLKVVSSSVLMEAEAKRIDALPITNFTNDTPVTSNWINQLTSNDFIADKSLLLGLNLNFEKFNYFIEIVGKQNNAVSFKVFPLDINNIRYTTTKVFTLQFTNVQPDRPVPQPK